MMGKIQGKVLVFACRRQTKFFFEVAQRTFDGEIICYSDWPSDAGGRRYSNLMPSFYEHYNNGERSKQLTEEDIKQIVYRCRVLRALSYEKATRMVHSMYLTVEKLVDDHQPDYFVSRSVDYYVLDILCRVCKRFNVASITLIGGSISNTIIVTRYGEYNFVRKPDEKEVERTLEKLLDNDSLISFGKKIKRYTFKEHALAFANFWFKNVAFKILSLLCRDPLNYRFLSSFTYAEEGYQHSFYNFSFPQFNSNWENELDESTRQVLYIPLSHIPECTTDYWLEDVNMIRDYEEFILGLCDQLSSHFTLLIKEHWSMMGRRKASFYNSLKEIPGVILVPSEINNRKVIQKIDKILLGVGTSGIEAALRGKCVVTLGLPLRRKLFRTNSINQSTR